MVNSGRRHNASPLSPSDNLGNDHGFVHSHRFPAANTALPTANEDPEQMQRAWPREEALAYTHWLATHHYENFQVVSFLLPKRLHRDFYNVYAFCRWSDDLG